MSETGKGSYFEQVIKEPFMKCTREQKARFALICAIRSLPLLSVKHFKQWEQSKRSDYLLSIFTTIDLSAGVLKNIDFNRMNIFQSDIPTLYNITKKEIHYYVQNNPNEHKIDSVYAVLDVASVFRFLSEYFWSFDAGDGTLKFQEMKDDQAMEVACSAYAAFEKAFTGNNKYLVEKFLELTEDDLSEIRRNDAQDFETDVSIYNGMFTTFLQDLSAIGLGDWANIYDRLFKNKLQFDESDLSERITDHEKRIEECPRSGEESLMSGPRNVLWYSKNNANGSKGSKTISDEFEKGVFFFEQEDYQKAMDWWTKGAEKGCAKAQAALGFAFEQGGHCKEAVYWYIKAAEQGDVNAQYHLGRIYADEDTGVYDRTKAKYWLSKAAIQGEEEAAEDLEVIVRFEKAEAEHKGTVDKNTEARYQLAYTYFVDKQYDKAFSILNDLANKGHANSQYILGLCYGRGDGLELDYEKAAKWWCKASEQGHADAIHFLKLLCKKDWDTLLRWTSSEKTDSKLS